MMTPAGRAWQYRPASEMGQRFTCRAASQRRSRGPQSDTSPGMADRPSERRCLGPPTPDLAGKEPGTPSTHARGQGGADWGEVVSPIPRTAWWPGRPSVGRPSEAAEQGVLRAPRAKVSGQRARARTPCSSFHPLGRPSRCGAHGVSGPIGRPEQAPAPHPGPLPALVERAARSALRGERECALSPCTVGAPTIAA